MIRPPSQKRRRKKENISLSLWRHWSVIIFFRSEFPISQLSWMQHKTEFSRGSSHYGGVDRPGFEVPNGVRWSSWLGSPRIRVSRFTNYHRTYRIALDVFDAFIYARINASIPTSCFKDSFAGDISSIKETKSKSTVPQETDIFF